MRDLVSGAAVCLGGCAYAVAAATSMPLGTLRQMGPGMMPMGLGAILAMLGAGIVIAALRGDAPLPKINFRILFVVLASVLGFAFAISHFGLLAAILASTLISALAIEGNRPLTIAVMYVVLSVIAYVIFVVLLQLTIPVFPWSH